MIHDPHAYTITIQKVRVDGDDYFESTIKELPDAAAYCETYQEAYELAIDTIETTAVMLEEAGREMPSPMVKQEDYSGRVTLRMAKSLHERVTTYAENEGVSLNSYINTILAEKVGATTANTIFRYEISMLLREMMTKTSQPDSVMLLEQNQNVDTWTTDPSTPTIIYQ